MATQFYQYPLSQRGLVDVPENAKRSWHRVIRQLRHDAFRVVKVTGGVIVLETFDDYRIWRNQK